MSDRRLFAERLRVRAARAGINMAGSVLERLTAYWKLLAKWSRTMNLTALPLDPPSDAALDRLFVEPLVAAKLVGALIRTRQRQVHSGQVLWYDLGSGGGSPAVPLRTLVTEGRLILVEAKERKAAFLREVIRALGLESVEVRAERFEKLAATNPHDGDLITVRAVKADARLAAAVEALLRPTGRLFVFHRPRKPLEMSSLRLETTHQLLPTDASFLSIYGVESRIVPRGT